MARNLVQYHYTNHRVNYIFIIQKNGINHCKLRTPLTYHPSIYSHVRTVPSNSSLSHHYTKIITTILNTSSRKRRRTQNIRRRRNMEFQCTRKHSSLCWRKGQNSGHRLQLWHPLHKIQRGRHRRITLWFFRRLRFGQWGKSHSAHERNEYAYIEYLCRSRGVGHSVCAI